MSDMLRLCVKLRKNLQTKWMAASRAMIRSESDESEYATYGSSDTPFLKKTLYATSVPLSIGLCATQWMAPSS